MDATTQLVAVQTVAVAETPQIARNWRTLWGLLGTTDLSTRVTTSAQKALDAGDAKLDALVLENQKLQAELRRINAEAALLEQQQRKLAAETRAENAKAMKDESEARRTDSERVRDELRFLEERGYDVKTVLGERDTIYVGKGLNHTAALIAPAGPKSED